MLLKRWAGADEVFGKIEVKIILKNQVAISQGCPKSGPRAKTGPRSHFNWPAASSEIIN